MLIRPLTKAHPLTEITETVAKLRVGKAPGIYNICAELFKAGGEVTICGLHAVLTADGSLLPFLLTGRGGLQQSILLFCIIF